MDSMSPFPEQLTEGLDQASEVRTIREHLQRQKAEDATMHLFIISEDTTASS
jgi:hypothetical protein